MTPSDLHNINFYAKHTGLSVPDQMKVQLGSQHSHLSPDAPTLVQQARQRLIAAALEWAEIESVIHNGTYASLEMGQLARTFVAMEDAARALYAATRFTPERSPGPPAGDPGRSSGFPGPLDE